jgi:hypothetical protein
LQIHLLAHSPVGVRAAPFCRDFIVGDDWRIEDGVVWPARPHCWSDRDRDAGPWWFLPVACATCSASRYDAACHTATTEAAGPELDGEDRLI